ncbi:hypothetical protein, partial [Vibrio harveyi]|uniref:hypothetical protein n=1 Tax=Vibrio harveyi TaxID=669 RepID=UPI001F33CC02
QSGYAADCKSVDLGSTPGGASIFLGMAMAISRCESINNRPAKAGFFVSDAWQAEQALVECLHTERCASQV